MTEYKVGDLLRDPAGNFVNIEWIDKSGKYSGATRVLLKTEIRTNCDIRTLYAGDVSFELTIMSAVETFPVLIRDGAAVQCPTCEASNG